MCILLYVSFICLHVYAFAIHSIWSIGRVPSSQALSSFLITAPPSVLVPDLLDALAVWIQKQNKKTVWRQQDWHHSVAAKHFKQKEVIYSSMFIVLCYGYMYDSLNTRVSDPAGDHCI